MNVEELVNFLREGILKCEEIVQNKDRQTKNDPEFSRGYWSGQGKAYGDVLRKLVDLGVTFEPDQKLIYEAETLIPKDNFICNHELNRTLRHYEEDFKNKNYVQCVVSERLLRRMIAKARLEVAKHNL